MKNRSYFPISLSIVLALGIVLFGTRAYGADPGEMLFNQHCGSCHTIMPPPEKAPPVYGISRHYGMRYSKRDQFVDAIVRYVKDPANTVALMPLAKKEFGEMAPIVLPDETLKKIADFIYRTGPQKGKGPYRRR